MEFLNSNNFNEKTKEGLVLIDFYANWCGPCKMLSPVLEEINEERDDVQIYKIDTDAEMELAMGFKVQSIPALFLIKDGKIVNQHVGYASKATIEAFIDSAK